MLIASKLALVVFMLAVLLAALHIATADLLVGRVHVIDSELLLIDNELVTLKGIRTFVQGTQCISDGKVWPCGDFSMEALAALAENRWLFCRITHDSHATSGTCHGGLDDVARAFVQQGWAIADEDRYVAAQREAMLERRGIWHRTALVPGS